MLAALAPEVGLRLRRHGVTGDERLVLYDRGDGVGAMPAAQMAELAGHPAGRGSARRRRCVAGRAGDRPGRAASGEDDVRAALRRGPDARRAGRPARRFHADDPRRAVARRSSPASAAIRAIRARDSIPGARHVPVEELFAGPGQPLPADQIRARLGDPERRSSRTATRARAPRWRRSRCARPAFAPVTTRARGTSGRATTSSRSRRADL